MEEHAGKKLVWENLLAMDFDSPHMNWQGFREGVEMLPLHGDTAQGCSCALLRYQPGAHIPRHLHVGMEFLLILRGSQRDERGHYVSVHFPQNPSQ